MNSPDRKPWWLYPNLLSLDAPLVSVAWLYVFAKTWRLGYHQWEAYACLGLVVWIIYATDRLLDVSISTSMPGARVEPRHEFHARHRGKFRLGIIIAGVTALVLLFTRLPYAIFSYLLLGGVLVAGFFGMSLLTNRESGEVPYAKNVLAGATFAFGTAMTAHLYRGEYGIQEMVISKEFLCFAVLCILNISAIDLWEHAAAARDNETRAFDEIALTLPLLLLGGASLMLALRDEQQTARPFFYAILTGAALLYVLNRNRARFPLDGLRVLADCAVLAPVLVFVAARGA
ncbi:MAG: hypothetical protein H7A49_06020 [Akkermansiaceae bacterium]|nr:hypothetical protein [Akkermansiaceae bacterium]MCP5546785.1 hypothetical protein [Akkermansiaceae bacterium]